MLLKLASTNWFIPAVAVALALLLVCEIPMFGMKIKKGMTSSKELKIMRSAFFATAALSVILTLALGLNWSAIVLITFTAYILINLAGAAAKKILR